MQTTEKKHPKNSKNPSSNILSIMNKIFKFIQTEIEWIENTQDY